MALFYFDYCLLLNDLEYLYLCRITGLRTTCVVLLDFILLVSYYWTSYCSVILVLFDTIATSTNEFDSESCLPYPAHN
jgi:hypothetical protein